MVHDTPQNTIAPAPRGFPAPGRILNRTILVVDDDALVLRAMQSLLRRSGFDTIGCPTGADAMSKCVVGIDAAVVDIHLPDINGLQLSQQIRQVLGPAVPIIILSGDTSMDTIRALPNAQATYFCSKPVNSSALIGQLKDWLGVGSVEL